MKRSVFIFILSIILIISGCAVFDQGVSVPSAAGSAGTHATAGNTETVKYKGFVGVTMPTKSLSRRSQDTDNLKYTLERLGYGVDLQYADNNPDTQIIQIENQIKEGCDVLVIASIYSGELGGVLEKAKEAGIPVIAYDRLLTNTDKCDYCVTFDSRAIGRMQGQYIADTLGISSGAKGPFTLECFAGDSGDNNARLFYESAMEVLQPFIDSGMLLIKSGQTDMEDIAIENWHSQEAQERTDGLLDKYYTDESIDAILSPNDSIAQGIVVSLKNHGYGSRTLTFPILTGQDCDKINIGQIIRGEQSMSIFRDKRVILHHAAEMVDTLLSGREVPVNTNYNNGVIDVPSYNCELKIVDADNWKEVLIDSGYYMEGEIPTE